MQKHNITSLIASCILFLTTLLFNTSCDVVVGKMSNKISVSKSILQKGATSSTIEETKHFSSYMAEAKLTGLELPAKLHNVPEQILQRKGYTVSYNSSTLQPNWVAWHLTSAHLKGNTKRSNSEFHEDIEVAEPRANTNDYTRSGYDRGHMCPAGDNKWNQEAMDQSFLLSNICPQAPSLNRGDWNEMEQVCRKWAKQYGDLYVVCGPIFYKKRLKTIGKNHVAVPDAFFKVVLVMKGSPKAIGFIYKNADGNRPKGDYANSVDEVERITGIDFFPNLPDKIETKVEAQYNIADWNL